MATSDPIRRKSDIKKLCGYFLEKNQIRNYVLIVMGYHTILRISDLLKLQVKNVYDINSKQFHRIIIHEQKTHKKKSIPLNYEVIKALKIYLSQLENYNENTFIFKSSRNENKAITRIQAYRIITEGAKQVNILGTISCHSLRKSFGYHASKDGIATPSELMELYNHSSYDVTKRYVCITQEELDRIYMKSEFM